MDVKDDVKAELEKALPGSYIEISDPMCDNAHFEAIVVAKEFEGLSLVKQHQLVMQALKEKFATTLHALGLKTYTPKEWDENGQ